MGRKLWLKPLQPCKRLQQRLKAVNNAGAASPQSEMPGIAILLEALKECIRSKDLQRGKDIHSRALDQGLFGNIYLASSLVNMYARCGSMADAQSVFDKMLERNVVTWNALLHGYVENGDNETALQLFHSLEQGSEDDCLPNARTYLAALASCANLGGRTDVKTEKSRWLETGKAIHSGATIQGCCNLFVESILVDMYAKCGSMRHSRSVFDLMDEKDVVCWNTLLNGYVENGEMKVVVDMFHRMEEEEGQTECISSNSRTYIAVLTAYAALATRDGKVGALTRKSVWLEKTKAVHSQAVRSGCCDMFVECSLVKVYGECGKMVHARSVFDGMACQDSASWNALIMGYVGNGDSKLALELISQLDVNGAEPCCATLITGLLACGDLVALEKGRAFHDEIRSLGFEKDEALVNCLLEFYGQCGNMSAAKEVFDSAAPRTPSAWNTLMGGYALAGDAVSVLSLFQKMEQDKLPPDEITFVHILNACGHAGLTSQGQKYFESMVPKYGVDPDLIHYNCMVDLLGRAGYLDQALEFVRKMPVEPNAVTWRTLLGACRKWNHADIGRLAYESLLKLDEASAAHYNLMANIYVTPNEVKQISLELEVCKLSSLASNSLK